MTQAVIIRTGASAQDGYGIAIRGDTAACTATSSTPAEATSAAITIAFAGTTPTAAGDLTLRQYLIEMLN